MFVPVGQASHRTVEHDPGGEMRLRLCKLAVAGDERFRVSRIELDRPGPTYSVDTLRELRRTRPEDELVLIIGGDEAAALRAWREPEDVLRLAEVAAVERNGERREAILEGLQGLEGLERLTFFDMPRVDVSASLIRARAAAGLPVRYLVPDAVAELIAAEALFGASGRAQAA